MTTEGYQALYGKLPDNYVFLVIEKEPPYLIEAFDAFRPCEGSDPSGMSYYDAGVHRFRQALNKYKECRDTNRWPGYSGKISPMRVPFYGLKELENNQ